MESWWARRERDDANVVTRGRPPRATSTSRRSSLHTCLNSPGGTSVSTRRTIRTRFAIVRSCVVRGISITNFRIAGVVPVRIRVRIRPRARARRRMTRTRDLGTSAGASPGRPPPCRRRGPSGPVQRSRARPTRGDAAAPAGAGPGRGGARGSRSRGPAPSSRSDTRRCGARW